MNDDHNNGTDFSDISFSGSKLDYKKWLDEAYRDVAVRALEHVSHVGLPGEHHFYLTFKTNAPQVVIPDHLKKQYPDEITIVLQHQFWDLTVDRDKKEIKVTLSFGGIASPLTIPFVSLTGFADPYMHLAFHFLPPPVEIGQKQPFAEKEYQDNPFAEENRDSQRGDGSLQNDSKVLDLDFFRKKH